VFGSLDLTGVKASRMSMRSVRVGQSLFAQRAAIATFFAQDLAVEGYSSFDQAEIKQLTLRDASFGEEARFRAIGWHCACTLTRVAFSDEASFNGNWWSKLRIDTCVFASTSDLEVGHVNGRFALLRSRMADLRRLSVDCWHCRLERSTFGQPVIVDVRAEHVDATGALFERGLDLALSPGAELTLAEASLAGDSFIATSSSWQRGGTGPARVVSLNGTRVERLTLRGLNLSDCAFSKARTLDAVVISGRGQLAVGGRELPWGAEREVLVDELVWRAAAKQNESDDGLENFVHERATSPHEIAETYRALRRGRETARDRPGAADFYYGEMEMRRVSAQRLPDRLVLSGYWLLSGYGLRASRAFVAYVLVVVTLTAVLLAVGLRKPAGLLEVVAYVLASTTALARPSLSLDLSVAGSYIQLVARLSGPVLFALMVLAIRERLRR
jgi:hypothetical protein